MKILNIEEIKKLSKKDCNEKVLEVQQSLFDLKFKQAVNKSIKPHVLRQHKKMLAQLLTINTKFKN